MRIPRREQAVFTLGGPEILVAAADIAPQMLTAAWCHKPT
jgi:hypothetical protein